MKRLIRDIPIHYEEYGEGKPVLNIHGWGPDYRMMSGCFEPIFEQAKISIGIPSFACSPDRLPMLEGGALKGHDLMELSGKVRMA